MDPSGVHGDACLGLSCGIRVELDQRLYIYINIYIYIYIHNIYIIFFDSTIAKRRDLRPLLDPRFFILGGGFFFSFSVH